MSGRFTGISAVILMAFTLLCGNAFAAGFRTEPGRRNPSRETMRFLRDLDVKLDGKLTESFWTQVEAITDFYVFRKKGLASKVRTEVKVCLDRKYLFLGIVCHDPDGIYKGSPQSSVWSNDNMEIFLGNTVEPDDWYRQIVISTNGKLYLDFIRKEEVRYGMQLEKNLWCVEMALPLAQLGNMQDNKLLFNLLRYRTRAKKLLTWSDVHWGHEADRFGTLRITTPAAEIIHGPWVLNCRKDSAAIRWETYDKNESFLLYREKGASQFRQIPTNLVSGTVQRDRVLHTAVLSNLKENTVYEYKLPASSEIYTFETLSGKNSDFSFVLTSDLHGRYWDTEKLLKRADVQKADLFFFAGDFVGGLTGRGVLYKVLLDPIVRLRSGKNFIALRGNHEYRGGNVKSFFDLFSIDGKKAYGAFLHKGIFFIYCDSDGDVVQDPSYQKEQTLFLQQIVKTPQFKNADFRVLLNHIPLLDNKLGGTSMTRKMFGSLSKEELASIDLMLAGHYHRYIKALPGVKKVFSTNKNRNNYAQTFQAPFPVLVSEASGCITVEKKGKILQVKVTDLDGKNIDQLSVRAKK